jgi:protein-disulfide isomerase
MASRTEQKAQLRAERLAQEQAQAAAEARRKRLAMIGGVVLVAVIVAVVAIAISSSSKSTSASAATKLTSKSTLATDQRVNTLLAGIPQESDNVLGKASAPVTIIEYGDLECSVCDAFALATNVNTSNGTPGSGVEDQIINQLVRTGKAKFVYDALDTATSNGVTPNEFVPQQVAAYAAGLQDKAWNYIELFYNEQGQEGTDYVNQAYLDGIAKQIPGLNYSLWKHDLSLPSLKAQVEADIARGTKLDVQAGAGGASTPSVLVSGKKGLSFVTAGIPSYSQVANAVKAES